MNKGTQMCPLIKAFFGQSRAQKGSKEHEAVRYIAALCTVGIELKEMHNLASLW